MNTVIYFSPNKGTYDIAKYVANYLRTPLISITRYSFRQKFDYSTEYDYVVFCFPVYSQNIPELVKEVINKIKAKYIIYIATYGRMGTGNVLKEASKLNKAIIIGGAYIPTKHTYKDGPYFDEFTKLNYLLDKIKNENNEPVSYPKRHKHLFANFYPNVRSRKNVKILKTSDCIDCGFCDAICPMGAIKNGVINKKCIRCLRCVNKCGFQGLEVEYTKSLKWYLRKDKVNDLIIYQ